MFAFRHLLLLQVLALMSDTLGVNVLQDVVHVCTFIKVLLDERSDEETLTISLGLLLTLLNGTPLMPFDHAQV